MQWNQSQFLQSLGWATLNSFWQMALLWCLYVGASRVFALSASNKYRAAVAALVVGFAWFAATGILYYQQPSSTYAFFANTVSHSNGILTACLFAASVTYLLLLVFPAVRLFRNWRFVQCIKKEGLSKADLHCRLFVQNIAAHLGITKKVKLVVSALVNSPVTVGYLKPIILLPVAVLNNLSTAQVEAILLHELSHIRRYDYLMNLVVSIIHTLLYFNPFVKNFVTAVENERETCCDELVLQFGYDKVGYASALLQLEKSSGKYKTLALAAAGKQNLLTRIEKIVGMEKKKTFRLVQVVPLLAALFCILLFNSVLIIQDAKSGAAMTYNNDTVFTPWQLDRTVVKPARQNTKPVITLPAAAATASAGQLMIDVYHGEDLQPELQPAPPMSNAEQAFVPAGFDSVDGSLSNEEKQEVKTTLEATKKAVSALQWKEIATSLADAMNDKEKAITQKQFQYEVDKVNWQNIEQNLKANYDKVNWPAFQSDVSKALQQVQLDSLQTVFSMALIEIQKLEKEVTAKAKIRINPVPDCSLQELKVAKQTLRKNLDSLKASRPKKIVQL